MLHQVLFFIFGALCVAGALNLLLQKHPINSALSLIVVMGSLALLYLLLGAEFVAAVQVIVYAGAIMVLFVFVIMLLNAGEEDITRGSRIAIVLGVPAVAAIAALVVYTLVSHTRDLGQVSIGSYYVKTQELGLALFREFLLPFEVTSVLILIAIMGAVVLARREH
jgi:NADH-quinone oxidoreductase subunit J